MRATVVLGVQGRLVVRPKPAGSAVWPRASGSSCTPRTGAWCSSAGRRLRGRYASSATRGPVEELLTERPAGSSVAVSVVPDGSAVLVLLWDELGAEVLVEA